MTIAAKSTVYRNFCTMVILGAWSQGRGNDLQDGSIQVSRIGS